MFALLSALSSCALIAAHQEKSFLSHLREHGLMYTGAEYHLRFGIFLANSRMVQEFNSQPKTFTLGLNHLSTLTPSEYRVLLGTRVNPWKFKSPKKLFAKTNRKAPTAWDWRTEGAVQVVKDQGQCGSCWAFAAIASEESMYFLYTLTLYNLSEQNLVDCDYNDYGCEGGSVEGAYFYVYDEQNGYFVDETNYPYTAVDGACQYAASINSQAYLNDFGTLANPTESNLLLVVYDYGPVACAIDASHSSFQLYISGVYDEPACSSDDLDHAVLTVGYSTDASGTDYWIVKNSWGTGWGQQGYIYMSRNKNNQCGIATDGVVPLID
jgi:cathepsin L